MSFNETFVKIGDNIRQAREEMGLSRDEAAKAIDVHYQYLGEIERGESNPTLEILLKLASLYKVSLSELIGESTHQSSSAGKLIDDVADDIKPMLSKLLYVAHNLKKSELKAIINLIKELKK